MPPLFLPPTTFQQSLPTLVPWLASHTAQSPHRAYQVGLRCLTLAMEVGEKDPKLLMREIRSFQGSWKKKGGGDSRILKGNYGQYFLIALWPRLWLEAPDVK